MIIESAKKKFVQFLSDKSGEVNLQVVAFAGGFAILVALVAAPALDRASKTYAENKAFGIDTVITGAIKKEDNARQYTVRKSVLDRQ